MIEVVFGDSACGSLKMAQGYGGDICGGCTGIVILHEDGSGPTDEEIRAAQRDAEEKQRRSRANGKPMGGKADDVYGLSLALSIGDIAEDEPGERRRETLTRMYRLFPEGEDAAQELFVQAKAAFRAVLERAAGEDIRVWYSDNPDELCGMYWLLAQLNRRQHRQIALVKLPSWEEREDGVVVEHTGWGEIEPGQWGEYAALQQTVSPIMLRYCAQHWAQRQSENTPLRAVLNGRLVSAEETIYDGFIRREIDAQAKTFREAFLIGCVLGKYPLGISDVWVALRIEAMIQAGELAVIQSAPSGAPAYHQVLQKRR